MINNTLDSLFQFLKKNHYESNIQEDTQQVYTIRRMNKKEYPLFLRVFDDGLLLQLLIFIPCSLGISEQAIPSTETPLESSPERKAIVGDLARLLHLFNKELDIPGFGMDEIAGVVFYRLMLPTPKKKIEEELLLAFLKTIDHVCQMFTPPIEAVCSGHMTLDQILAKAQEIEQT